MSELLYQEPSLEPSPQLGHAIGQELARVENALETGEVLGVPTRCLLGLEIEFRLEKLVSLTNSEESYQQTFGNTPSQVQDNCAQLEGLRQHAAAEIGLLVPTNEEEARKKKDWLGQIPLLTTKELAMYEIHRRLSAPTLGGTPSATEYLASSTDPERSLEFYFGNKGLQEGYYDGRGVFEVAIMAAKPTVAMLRRQRFIETSQEVARKYGLWFVYSGDQPSLSLWQPDEDGHLRLIHARSDDAGQRNALSVAAGMLLGLQDIEPGVLDLDAMAGLARTKEQTAGPDRMHLIRALFDRFEARRSIGEKGSMALTTLGLIAGAVYGLKHPEEMAALGHVSPEPYIDMSDGFDKQTDHYLLRALQHGTINAQGQFVPNPDYSDGRDWDIMHNILGIDIDERTGPNIKNLVMELLSTITADPEGDLRYDTARFDAILAAHPTTAHLAGDRKPDEQLKHIRRQPPALVVRAGITGQVMASTDMHRRLAAFASSQVLTSLISEQLLAAVAQERKQAFTHEWAVTEYFDLMILDTDEDEGTARQRYKAWRDGLAVVLNEIYQGNDPEAIKRAAVHAALDRIEQHRLGVLDRLPYGSERVKALHRFVDSLQTPGGPSRRLLGSLGRAAARLYRTTQPAKATSRSHETTGSTADLS